MASVSRFYLSLVFLCLALLMVVSFADEVNKKSNDERTIRDKDVSARMQRRSGKIMVVRDDDGDNSGDDSGDDSDDDNDDSDDNDGDDDDDDFRDDNEDLLSFELDEIEEKDADGNDVGRLENHFEDNFDDVNFQFSPVSSNAKLQGVSAINVNMSAYLDDPMANLDIMVYLFREDGTIKFGSESFDVQAGTVKFNIKISNWDFCDGSPRDCSEAKAGEYLDLSMKIKSKGSASELDDEDRKKAGKPAVCKEKPDNDNDRNDNDDDDDCPIIYDVGGDSEMLINRGVMNDNDKYTAMPAGFPKFEIEDGEKKFKFRIPKFQDNVVVDPSVTPGKVSAANACWMQISNVVFILLLQFAALYVTH